MVEKSRIPPGLWVKCKFCNEIVYRKEVERNLNVCPKCDYHFRISAKEWIALLCDQGRFEEYDAALESADPLNFNDTVRYRDRLRDAQRQTNLKEGVIAGKALLNGVPAVLAVLDFNFMGGSLGVAAGEKIARAMERTIKERLSLVIISSSGGARMQEGIYSLMQMAKTCTALSAVKESGLLYISVLADPTTGGVAASFAMLGDVIIAEPRALIGFAGPRVIEETIKQKLPEGFQRAEFLLEHGMIDLIVERKEMKRTLSRLLQMFSR